MCYIYTREYYLAIKQNEIMSFAVTWVDLEIIILSEVKKRMTNFIYHLYVKSKRMIQINLLIKHKWTHRPRKETLITKGRGIY